MYSLSDCRRVHAGVDLVQGLDAEDVATRLHVGNRLTDTGQRILAFYLVEMADRDLHNDLGCSSTVLYAEDRLGLDKRRVSELLSVGRKLLELPAIDTAFCEQRIGWTKLVLLSRVASPAHEEAWLEEALEKSTRKLELAVQLARPGGPPRKPGDRKGLPVVRHRVNASLDKVTHRKLRLAQEMMAAEVGRPVTIPEVIAEMSENFLNTEADGSVPGRRRVRASLYRIVLRHGEEDDEHDDESDLWMDTDLGRVPVEPEELEAGPDGALDCETPPWMRDIVLARDGFRCRCCERKGALHAHHIHWRSHGGQTIESNLTSLCPPCHALVHDRLLLIVGTHAKKITFTDDRGRPLHAPNGCVPEEALLRLEPPRAAEASEEPAVPSPPPTLLENVPPEIDATWWRRHADQILSRAAKGLHLREEVPLPMREVETPDEAPPPEPVSPAEALPGVVGQDARLARLARTAAGSRALGLPFPHLLLAGPAGTGKTLLAAGIAALYGARLVRVSGPMLQDVHVLLRLLASLGPHDVLFVDEVHAVPRAVLEALYEALGEQMVSLTLHARGRSRGTRLKLPPFTLLAATTERGTLPEALRSRFGLQEEIGYYEEHDLATLVTERAELKGFRVAAAAASRLAARARGTPRNALRLLDLALREAAAEERTAIDLALVDRMLESVGYDARGLLPDERRYLAVLAENRGPMSVRRIANRLGTTIDTVIDLVEPYLFLGGFVSCSSRGRVLAATQGATKNTRPAAA